MYAIPYVEESLRMRDRCVWSNPYYPGKVIRADNTTR